MVRMSRQPSFVKLGHYNSLKGGTAPGELRANFLNLFHELRDRRLKRDDCETLIHVIHKLKRASGMLWNCTDKVPLEESRLIFFYRKDFYNYYLIDSSITYAQAARALRPHINYLEGRAARRDAEARATKSWEAMVSDIDLEEFFDGIFD